MDDKAIIKAFSDTDIAVDDRFVNIAKWFIRFLKSEEHSIRIVIPFYDQEFAIKAYNSLVDIGWAYNLLKDDDSERDYSELRILKIDCLKGYNNGLNVDDCFLELERVEGDLLIWEEGTYTNKNGFFPLFHKDQLENVIDLHPIINTFPYFKKIRSERLLNEPFPVDLEKGKILFYDCGEISNFDELKRITTRLPFLKRLVEEGLLSRWRLRKILKDRGRAMNSSSIRRLKRDNKINEIEIEDAHELDDEEAANKEEQLLDEDIYLQIRLKYPYSKDPHHYLYTPGKKKALIQFRNRFLNKGLDQNDINLLPREVLYASKSKIATPNISVVSTNHSRELFELLSTLKEKWRNLGLNKFVVPFPKYWFQFIHNGESIDFWIEQFKRSYPALINRPILSDIERIIWELHSLNWIEEYIAYSKSSLFLFPKPIGLRSKRLQTIILSFKNHIEEHGRRLLLYENSNLLFEESANQVEMLCGFNIPDIINIIQNPALEDVKITIPDFLYFNYQPWIPYHLFMNQAEVLENEMRISIDHLAEQNRSSINERKSEIIRKIKRDYRSYQERFDIAVDEVIENENSIDLDEDIELTNEEELDLISEVSHRTVKVETADGQDYSFDASERILVKRDSILKLPSNGLQLGDLFLTDEDIKHYSDDDMYFRKLTSIPKSSKYYQKRLNERPKAFEALQKRGLSITSPDYFKDRYQRDYSEITDESFIIPRSKRDWEIICEYLNIEEDSMNTTFTIAKTHGRRIRRIYSEVINMLIESDSMGMMGDPNLIADIMNILSKGNGNNEEEDGDNNEVKELAKAILSTISASLDFHEVKDLTYE